jgi:sialidase-1
LNWYFGRLNELMSYRPWAGLILLRRVKMEYKIMRRLLSIVLAILILGSCNEIKSPSIGILSFDDLQAKGFLVLDTKFGNWIAAYSKASIVEQTDLNKSGTLFDTPMIVDSIYNYHPKTPALIGKEDNLIVKLIVKTSGTSKAKKIKELIISTSGTTDLSDIEEVKVYFTGSVEKFSIENPFGKVAEPATSLSIKGEIELQEGNNFFWVSYKLSKKADLLNKVAAAIVSVNLGKGNKSKISLSTDAHSKRIGYALRKHMDDDIHTYRIPGLATTNNGTLIGVYDNRRNGSVDLQEDVDIGMSRSTDGGKSWEPMKVIVDMGEWGGKPQEENGIGDPSILVDRQTNTIWVAGIWAHGHPGKRNWLASKPGLEEEQTSQFVLVKSEDDGITWSEPINITKQIKDSKWHLLLAGPGKGITLKDGTLIFPAQFKDEKQVPHSTLIFSKDHGETWRIGNALRHDTTEAQLVQLKDGSIMINARNDEARNTKGIGRVVGITRDLGQSWKVHQSSITALEESTCMASLVNLEFEKYGKFMLFSNPNTHSGRHHITIKASFDEGKTWPLDKQLLLDEGNGRGYSCITKIDEETIGILYEGSQSDMVFEKVLVSEIFNQ